MCLSLLLGALPMRQLPGDFLSKGGSRLRTHCLMWQLRASAMSISSPGRSPMESAKIISEVALRVRLWCRDGLL